MSVMGEERVKAWKDQIGRTPLHLAAARGQTNTCLHLIRRLNFDPNLQDNEGFTPLDAAAMAECYDATAAATAEQEKTFICLLKEGAKCNVARYSKLTTLHHVAAKGWKNVMNTLIAKGADVNAQSLHGTPLQFVTHFGIKIAVQNLLAKKANPNTCVPQSYTPLMQAIRANSVDCVTFLLKAGADPNMTALGYTPLTLATEKKEIKIIRHLLKAGANANATNYFGLTAIEIAATKGDDDKELIALLFDATARIPRIPDWSCSGIVTYLNSDVESNERERKFEEKYLEAIAKGAEAFERGRFLNAIAYYTTAENVTVTETEKADLLADISKCWACLNEGNSALRNALKCISLREEWPTAYFRAGVAWKMLGHHRLAADKFKKGLELDPKNKELRDAYKDVVTELVSRIQSLNANE